MRKFAGLASSLFTCAVGAACGSETTYTDAGTLDADPLDATAVLTGDVTVTTHSRCCDSPQGTLVEGVQVLVIQRDGAVGDSGLTDATGTIVLEDVEEGASVTAVYQDGEQYDLVTIVGVEPGDELVFGEHYTPTRAGTDGSLTVSWPQVAGTYYYNVTGPCGGSNAFGEASTSTTIYFYSYCQTPTADLQFVAYDTSYNILSSGVVADAPYTGTAVALPAWTAPLSFTVTSNNLPAPVEEVYLGAYAVVDGTGSLGDTAYTTPVSGSASSTLAMAATGDRIAAWSSLWRPGEFGVQESYQHLGGAATAATFDTVELPWVGGILVSAASRAVTWIQIGEQPYDGAVATASWSRYVPDGGEGGTYTYFDWQIIMPPGTTSFTWQSPPAAIESVLPTRGDAVDGEVMLVDLSSADGYDALRGVPEWDAACPGCSVERGDLASATISFSGDGGEGLGATRPQPTRRPAAVKVRKP
jgi:hypothetical protein